MAKRPPKQTYFQGSEDYAKQVSSEIIEQIKHGTAPWQKPWKPGEQHSPSNLATGKAYTGGNSLYLMSRQISEGRGDNRWGTYRQIEAAGGQVRRGEQGTKVLFYQNRTEQPAKDETGKIRKDKEGKTIYEETERSQAVMRQYTVFNVEQTDIPRRIYYGAVRAQKRYFALKLPVAGGADTVTFAYVDPGHATAVELHSWGAAHGQLWDAIRAKGRRVEVIAIGAELDTVLRADRVLQLWAAAEPGKVATGLTVKQEIELLERALDRQDLELFDEYGGMQEAINRYIALGKLPEAELAEGVSIDDYSTFRATRFSEPV